MAQMREWGGSEKDRDGEGKEETARRTKRVCGKREGRDEESEREIETELGRRKEKIGTEG